jgi:hypothetical protein
VTKPLLVRARCLSCGGHTVICLPSDRLNSFTCSACGQVVPCEDGFARAQDFDRFSVVRHGVKGCRAVAGCLSCGCDVLYPVLVQPEAAPLPIEAGDCVNCGRVKRVTP